MGWFGKKAEGKRQAATTERLAATVGSYNHPPLESVVPAASNYVAPNILLPPASPAQSSVVAQSTVVSQKLLDIDDEEMVVVDKHQVDKHHVDKHQVDKDEDFEDDYNEIENPTSTSYSRAGDSDPEPRANYGSDSKQTHLNSLFNGHLMKWKYEAEEGTAFLRVPAFFGALALLVTAIVAVVLYPEAWEPRSIVMTACVVIMSLFIIILEGRFIAPNPLNARAHVRNIVTRNLNILRFVWGRGLLYIIAGTINVAQTWIITMASGGVMIFLGFISIFVGVHASRKFAALRNSLADESYLLLLFSYYDSDSDGYLEPYQFAILLSYLGMEVDDRYALKAFNAIDRNGDRRVTFDEFSQWWTNGYIERGRKGPAEYEEASRRP